MAYSEVSDLLLGDLLLPPAFDKQKWVDDAAEEMDSKLGFVYALPLRVEGVHELSVTEDSWLDLPTHQVLLLKSINNRLASGRLILAQALAGEETALHAYGKSLVDAALADLFTIANGDVIVDMEPIAPLTDIENKAPSITNHDEESLLLGWENVVMRDTPWYTRPGAIP